MFSHKITSNECVSYVPSIIVLRSSWFSECYGLQLETARTPLSSVCTHDALDFWFLIKHMRDPIILDDQNHLFCFDRANAPLFASCRLADYHVKTNLELDKSNQLTQPLHIHVLRELFVFIFSISPEKKNIILRLDLLLQWAKDNTSMKPQWARTWQTGHRNSTVMQTKSSVFQFWDFIQESLQYTFEFLNRGGSILSSLTLTRWTERKREALLSKWVHSFCSKGGKRNIIKKANLNLMHMEKSTCPIAIHDSWSLNQTLF